MKFALSDLEALFLRFRYNGHLRGLVRTVTPLAVGLLSTDFANAFITSTQGGSRDAMTLSAAGMYYFVALKIEAKFPRAGLFLLGAKGAPRYDTDQNQAEVLAIAAEEKLLAQGDEREPAVPFS